MKPSEATVALTLAASFDNRQVSEAGARAWAEIMPHIGLEDAKNAIIQHFATSREYLMPVDVIRLVNAMRAERTRSIELPIPPRELADYPQAESQWLMAFKAAISDGASRDSAVAIANASQGITPDTEPLAVESTEAIKDRMRITAEGLARAFNLAAQERAAKAEALREFKAKRKAAAEAAGAAGRAEA